MDLQGWGRDIVTAGYGLYYNSEGQDLWFTHAFGGTSGASPMVTAAAAVVQSTYLVKNGAPASPSAVKTLLRNTGTPQAGSDTIGPQPDLKAAIESIWDVAPPQSPNISPASGTYDMPIEATIAYASGQNWDNTAIRYTLDDSEPTPDDYMYIPEVDDGIYLLYGVTLKAKAFQYHAAAGRSFESESATVTYTSSTPKVSTPLISPAGGSYDQPHQVTIATDTPGATIRYRTDGRSISFFYPGTLYSGPITLEPGSYEIVARAYRDGYYKSDLAHSGEIVVNPTTLPAPTLSPDGGQFAGEAMVSMQTTVIGADIHYTLDGSTPTTSSPIFDTAIPLITSATVKARAFLSGYTPSPVTEAAFDIVEQAAAPVITPNGGAHTGSAEVELSTTTPGATIRYTDNGAEPTSFSTLYEEPFVLGAGQHTVRAKAFLEGSQPSSTSTASFTVYESPDGTVEDPTMTPFHTQYFVEPFTISMHTDTEGATIYYTMQDGSLPPDPTESDTEYSGPFTISSNGDWYFKMRAYKNEATPSGTVQSGMLSLGNALGTTNAPTISPNGGVFTNTVQVSVSSPDNFETFFYTTDGSDPVAVPPVTPPSKQYNGPFNVSAPTTVSARAYRPFFASGGIASADFTFVCDTPAISPAGGTFTETATIELSTGTDNARIYYTLDGSEPDEGDTEYSGPFILEEGDHVVKARCFRTNYEPSATAVSVVMVQPEPVAPSFTLQPAGQTVDEGQEVTFTAEATGVPAPQYQWQRDGIDLAGQTEPELTIAAARPGDAGRYRLVAWNSAGETASVEALLTVRSAGGGGSYELYMPMLVR
ncbi:MAG: chitobiase/beta-hexosaminidase C-terminal domain-containing protein [Chloroflexota bacterium]